MEDTNSTAPVSETPATIVIEEVIDKPVSAPLETAPVQEPAKVQEEKKDPFAKNWGALHRKEKALREAEKSQKEISVKMADFQKLMELKDQNPAEFLEKIGLSFDKVLEQNFKSSTPEEKVKRELEQKINSLKEEMTAKEDAARKQELDRRIEHYKQVETQRMTAAGDDFELINALGHHEDVFELIELTWKKQGIQIDALEAAKQIEELLQEQESARLTKLSSLKKLKKQEVSNPETQQATTQPQQASSGTKTLSNSTAASPVKTGDGRKLTQEEKDAIALATLKWD